MYIYTHTGIEVWSWRVRRESQEFGVWGLGLQVCSATDQPILPLVKVV